MWNIYWMTFALTFFVILKDYKSHARYQENYIEEDKFLPNFITIGQKYSIAIGSTVVLPCKINETEHSSQYVLAWKRNIAVLTAGQVKVTVNPRIRLMPPQDIQNNEPRTSSYNLEIRDVRLSDAGEYACQIGSMEPKEIVHKLEVLVPPKINTVTPSTRVDVSKGASIRLECRANGNPPPKIIWSRKNNVMPNGEPNITSSELQVMYADRHTVGNYRCTADNRVGQPDTKDIFVNVLYSPEIEVEQPLIHTGVGFEAKLTCIVHAEPLPHVIWYKDTTQLGTTEQHSQQTRGNRYSLIIRNVTNNDLGNYTCQASNNLGKDRASLTLSAIPTVCLFDSPPLSNYRDQYNISWTVQSYSPIREYRLFYRKEVSPRSHSSSHHEKLDNHIGPHYYSGLTYAGSGSSTSSGGYLSLGSSSNGIIGSSSTGSGIYQEHEKWKNIVISGEHPMFNEHDIGGMGYTHPYGYGNNGGGNNLLGMGNSGTLYKDPNVQSYSPIREYRLFYRKEVSPRSHSSSHHEKLDNHIGPHYYSGLTYAGSGSSTSSGGYLSLGSSSNGIIGSSSTGSGIYQEHEKWKNIVISGEHPMFNEHDIGGMGYTHPYGYGNNGGGNNLLGMGNSGTLYKDPNGVNRNHNIRHRMSYLIRNLTPAANYEARVQARNEHDWNKLSSVFYFSTRAEDLELEPSAQPAVSKTAGVLDKDAFSGGTASGTITKHTINLLQLSTSSYYLNRILSVLIVLSTFLSL